MADEHNPALDPFFEPANTSENKKPLPDAAKPFMWQPGQSGNPSGRPKKKPITDLYDEIFADESLREGLKHAIIARLTSTRIVGSMELKEAAERVEGKVVQKIDADITLSSLAERMNRAADRAKE